jgi:hypothetical protein
LIPEIPAESIRVRFKLNASGSQVFDCNDVPTTPTINIFVHLSVTGEVFVRLNVTVIMILGLGFFVVKAFPQRWPATTFVQYQSGF